MAVARCAVVRRARRCPVPDPRSRPRPRRRAGRLACPRGARPGGRAACGWSSSCTCRWARARRMTASASGRARCSRPPPASSPPARGPGESCSSSTRCRPTASRSPSPASTPPSSRLARPRAGALLSVAAVDTRQGPRRAARRAGDADGPSLAVPVCRQPGARPERSSNVCAAASPPGGWTAGCASRARRQEPSSPAATARRTCWCCRRARRRTGWSSPRRWHEGCRLSPPTSAECRRRSVMAPNASGRACSCPPDDAAGAGRRAASLARGHGSAPAAAARGARAARVARRLVDHRLGRRGRDRGSGAMTVEAIPVTPAWLDLRERADAAARSQELVSRLRDPSAGGRPPGHPRPRLRQRMRWAGGSPRSCPGRSTGSSTTATPTC